MDKQQLQHIIQQFKAGHMPKQEALQLISALQGSAQVHAIETAKLIFKRVFNAADCLLNDHRLFAQPVLMGVAYASLAIEGQRQALLAGKQLEISNLLLQQPLILNPLEQAEVELQYEQDGAHYKFTSRYLKSESKSAVVAASGKLALIAEAPALSQKTVEIAKIQQKALIQVSGDLFYQAEQQTNYGPSLFSVKQVYGFGDEVWADIALSELLTRRTTEYVLHPALLDAMHVAIAFALNPQQPLAAHWPPLLIKKMQVSSRLVQATVTQGYAHVQVIKRTAELIEANVEFYAAGGDLLVKIEGFCTKRIPSAEAFLMTETVEASTQPQSAVAQTGTFADYIEHKFAQLLGRKPDQQKNFMELGLSSSAMIKLVKEFEQELGIELYPTLFFEQENIAKLVSYLTAEYGHSLPQFLSSSEAKTKATVLSSTKAEATITSNQMNAPGQEINGDIAIIGMAGRYAGASNLEQFWQNLAASKDMITEIPSDHWDYRSWFSTDAEATNKTYSKWGSFVADVDKFDAQFFDMSGREAVWTDPQLRLLLEVFQETVDDAALGQKIFGSNTGVYVGSCFHEYWDEIVRAHIPLQDYQHHSSVMSSLSARVSYTYDLRGGSVPMDNACASSLTALHFACQALRLGEQELAFVAGVNLLLSPLHYVYFSRIKALSPTGHCYSFDERGDGYVPGEGVAGVLLKPLAKALADGDRIHAIIKGSAINHAGRASNPLAPRPEQQVALLTQAWKNAGIEPTSISYIEAHGTGTKLGDPIEINALKQAFKAYTQQENFCAIGSAKSHLGHLEAAAGITGIIKVVLAMQHRQIPKMPMFTKLNPYIKLTGSPLYINTELTAWQPPAGMPRRAGISAFGMTGNNAHVVLEEAPPLPEARYANKSSYLLTLSAKQEAALMQQVANLSAWLSQHPASQLEDIAYTLNVGRVHYKWRCALVVTSTEDLAKKLNQLQSKQSVAGSCWGHTAEEASTAAPAKNCFAKLHTLSPQQADYPSLLAEIAKFYVQGYEPDWNLLHQAENQQKISLPAYAFSKERYWYESLNPVVIKQPTARAHYVLPEPEAVNQGWRFNFELNHANLLMAQHRVFKVPVLPADVLVELSYAAARACSGKEALTLKDFVIYAPLLGEESNQVELSLAPVSADIYQVNLQSDSGKQHVSCLVGVSPPTKPDISRFKLTGNKPVYHAIAEVLSAHYPIQLGEFYQAITEFSLQDDYAVAQLKLPAVAQSLQERFYLQPSILDSALSMAIVLAHHKKASSAEQVYVPVYMEEIQIFAPLLAEQYTVIVESVLVSDSFQRFNVYLVNTQQELVLFIKGLDEKLLSQTDLPISHAKQKRVLSQLSSEPVNEAISALQLQEKLSSMLAQTLIVPVESITQDKGFNDLGMDSILSMEFIKKLNQAFNLNVKATVLYEHPTLSKLIAYLLNQWNTAYQLPTQVMAVNQVESANVKVALKTLNVAATNSTTTAPTLKPIESSVAVEGELATKLTQLFAQALMLAPENLDKDKTFNELGVDSILAMEFIKTLNQQLGLSLKATVLYEQPTLNRLTAYLTKHYQEPLITTPQASSPLAEVNKLILEQPAKLTVAALETKPDRVSTNQANAIAIVGVAFKFPGANTVAELWHHLEQGNYLLGEVPTDHWDYRPYYQPSGQPGTIYARCGGFIQDIANFDPLFFNISPKDAELMDPQLRLLLQTCYAAVEDAGFAQQIAGSKTGVYIGNCFNDYLDLLKTSHDLDYARVGIGNHNTMLANRVGYFLDTKGPNLTLDTACSSSLVALHLACQAIQNQDCETALVGAVNLNLTPYKYLSFCAMQAFSKKDTITPFDETADGYLPGEGVAALLLKPLDKAMANNDHIYGVIQGCAVNFAGHGSGPTVPNPEQECEVMLAAWEKAGISAETIDYYEAHGTGTKLGDPLEINAIKQAFAARHTTNKNFCGLGTIKANLGHTEAVAGLAGLIKILLQFKYNKIPVLPKLNQLNELIELADSPLYINRECIAWPKPANRPRQAVVSSFGIGGTYAHAVLADAPELAKVASVTKPYYLITLSAKQKEVLEQRITDLLNWLTQSSSESELEAISYSLNTGRQQFDWRCALVVADKAELKTKLTALKEQGKAADCYYGKVAKESSNNAIYKKVLQSVLQELNQQNHTQQQPYKENLLALANLYVEGYPLAWQVLHQAESQRKLSLPTYPFLQEKYWYTTSKPVQHTQTLADDFSAKLFSKQWCPAERAALAKPSLVNLNMLVLIDEQTAALGQSLLNQWPTAQLLKAAELNSFASEALQDKVVWVCDLASLTDDNSFKARIAWMQKLVTHAASLFILHISQDLTSSLLAGLVRMLPAEYRKVKAKTVAIKEPSPAIIEQELVELLEADCPVEVEYQAGVRQIPAYHPLPPVDLNQSVALRLDPNKVYVVTGGVRGVGAAVAEYLVACGAKKLVLMGKQQLPAQDKWKELLATASTDSALRAKLSGLQELVTKDIVLQIYTGELWDNKLQPFMQRVRHKLGPIGGVLHCAGALGNQPAFIHKAWDEIASVLAPKVQGLNSLHEIFKTDELDFFILFSSVAGQLPSLAAGFSDYALANYYMDAFASYQREQGFSYYQSLNWPNWSNMGMGDASGQRYQQLGFSSHTKEQGLALLAACLAELKNHSQLLPAIINTKLAEPRQWLKVHPTIADTTAAVVGGETGDLAQLVLAWLSKELADLLKLDPSKFDQDTPFGEFGVDSILIASFIKQLEQRLQIHVEPNAILEYPTLKQLTHYFIEQHSKVLQSSFGQAAKRTTEPAMAIQPKISAIKMAELPCKQQPIAVIGLACHFPGANDKNAFWQNLKQGICSVQEVPASRWDSDKHYSHTPQQNKSMSKWGGFIEGIEYFEPGYFGLAAEDALFIDPLVRQCLEVSVEALADAGYTTPDIAGRKVGVFVGSRVSHYASKVGPTHKNSIIGLGQNFIAAMLSHVLNLTGPSMVLDTACSSSLVSIHQACQSILQGECELAFAGGVDILLDEQIYIHLSQAKALSADGLCHTFDEKANGFVPGEGCGMVILKPLDKALVDGDVIYGVIEASAVNNDGRTMGVTTPNLQAQQEVIETALHKAAIDPTTISYVETHGTATLIGDPIELKALTKAFTHTSHEHQYCAVGSVKSNVGHLLSAAGVAGFIKLMLMLQHKQLPPTLHCQKPNPRFAFDNSPFYPNIQLQAWSPRNNLWRAAISAFGFGGTNAHLIVQSFERTQHPHYQQLRAALAPPIFNKQWYWFSEQGLATTQVTANQSETASSMDDYFELIKRA